MNKKEKERKCESERTTCFIQTLHQTLCTKPEFIFKKKNKAFVSLNPLRVKFDSKEN